MQWDTTAEGRRSKIMKPAEAQVATRFAFTGTDRDDDDCVKKVVSPTGMDRVLHAEASSAVWDPNDAVGALFPASWISPQALPDLPDLPTLISIHHQALSTVSSHSLDGENLRRMNVIYRCERGAGLWEKFDGSCSARP